MSHRGQYVAETIKISLAVEMDTDKALRATNVGKIFGIMDDFRR